MWKKQTVNSKLFSAVSITLLFCSTCLEKLRLCAAGILQPSQPEDFSLYVETLQGLLGDHIVSCLHCRRNRQPSVCMEPNDTLDLPYAIL
jgi:hypothetical protein